MFRDTKNVVIKVFSWLLLAKLAENMHNALWFVHLDVFHLDYVVTGHIFQVPFSFEINDLFVWYNAPEKEHLDIQYWLFLLGWRFKDASIAYIVYSLWIFATTLFSISANVPTLNIYKKIHKMIVVYLIGEVFLFLAYLTAAGQLLPGIVPVYYLVSVFLIFFKIVRGSKWYKYEVRERD